MQILLYVIFCFSFAFINILSLYLIFINLIYICLIFPRIYPVYDSVLWSLSPFLCWGSFQLYSNIFLGIFSFSSSGTPIIQMLVHLILSLRPLRFISIFFLLFFFTLILGSYFHHSIFPGGASGKEPTCQCRRHKR